MFSLSWKIEFLILMVYEKEIHQKEKRKNNKGNSRVPVLYFCQVLHDI
jgi:hypothetical protein